MKNRVLNSNVRDNVESLFFDVHTSPVFGRIGDLEIVDPDRKVLIGHHPEQGFFPIATMGDDYSAFDYRKVFYPADEAMRRAGAELVRAGIVSNGGRFFATYRVNQDVSPQGRDDITYPEITIRSSLNGSWRTSLAFGFWRTVCENGIASFSVKDMLLSFRRTKNAEEFKLPEIPQAVEKALGMGETYQNDMSRLVEIPMTAWEANAAAVAYLLRGDELSTRVRNEAEEITALFSKSPGVRGESAYDALQGFTHYFSHPRGERARDQATWFENNHFGLGAEKKAGFARALLSDHRKLVDKGVQLLAA